VLLAVIPEPAADGYPGSSKRGQRDNCSAGAYWVPGPGSCSARPD